jgi:hypothetical protein
MHELTFRRLAHKTSDSSHFSTALRIRPVNRQTLEIASINNARLRANDRYRINKLVVRGVWNCPLSVTRESGQKTEAECHCCLSSAALGLLL